MSEFIEFLSPSALSEMQKANDELVKMVANVKAVQTEMSKISTPSGGDASVKQLTAQYQEQQRIIQSLQQQIQKLTEAKIRKNQASALEKVMASQQLKIEKDAALAVSSLTGAYQKLSLARAKAKNTLRDLIASESASTAEIKKAQREFDILDQKVRKADKAVGDFSKNVGNYKTAFSGLSNLMGAFGIATGLSLGADIIKSIYQTTKELQSLDLALKMVSGTQQEYAANQSFVTEVSNKWGLEIKSLTQQYTQFYTASKGLLSQDAIKKTFEGIAKAGAIMGLSLEKQSAAFYAIDQMMSKGTVTAEELKKQLGNAMPGAIKAAAMAYMDLHPRIKDIQEAEKALYAGMKKGAIDSATYVPLIVQNFQKLYGIENVDKVDTLIAAQNRLQNSWTNLVRSLNESNTGAITTIFTKLTESANGFLMILTRINDSWDIIFKKAEEKGTYAGQNMFENLMGGKKGEEAIKQAEQNLRIARQGIETFVNQINEQQVKLSKINPYALNFGPSPKSVKLKIEELKMFKAEYVALYNLSKEFLTNKDKTTTPLDTEGDNATKQRIRLNYAEAESLYNLKIARLEEQRLLAESEMNNKDATDYGRLQARKEFSRLSVEIIDEQYAREKAISDLKFKEDLDRANEIYQKNKKNGYDDIRNTQEWAKAIQDITNRHNNEIELANINHSKKWKDLMYADAEYNEKIAKERFEKERKLNQKIYEETNKLNEQINKAEQKKYQKIANDEKLTLKTRQAAFLEYQNLALKQLDIQKNIELAQADPTEYQNIIEKYKELKLAITDLESPLDKANEKTKAFIEGFKSEQLTNALQAFGLESAKIFLDFDENGQTTFGKLLEAAKTTKEEFAVTFNAIADVAQSAFNTIAQASQANFEEEYNRLEQEKNIAIAFAGDSASARQEIEEQYERRRRQIAKREAKAKKEMAIMNIAIDTAQAIVAAWVKPGFPLAIPISALIAGLGAAQIALVSSQKIPEYWRGTDNAEGGLAWTQEKGREIITDSQGRIKSLGSDKGAELTMLSKGDKVYNAEKTAMMFDNSLNSMLLNNGILMPKVEVSMDTKLIGTKLDKLSETIASKESFSIIRDAKGERIYQRKQNERKELLNNILNVRTYGV